jgi:hypothetical protein
MTAASLAEPDCFAEPTRGAGVADAALVQRGATLIVTVHASAR